jgi:hypothetical protein
MPPCFSWDITDLNGQLLGTVSDIDISRVSMDFSKRRIENALYGQGLKVKGYTEDLKVSDENRQGMVFIVFEIIEAS